MGYHTKCFEKGVYGEFSKVQEEWEELLDARGQNAHILEICELADLYGAIAGYVERRFGMTMADVALMSRMTSEAFAEGVRKASKVHFTPCKGCGLKPNEESSVSIRANKRPYCNDCWRKCEDKSNVEELNCVECLLSEDDDDDLSVCVRDDGKVYCHVCWWSMPENRRR